MLDSLIYIYHNLINTVSTKHYRFLYSKLDLNNRLIGIIGPRGAGKTTLLLQYIKNKLYDQNHVFYFSADHIYFSQTSIYQFIEEMFLTKDIRIFFIDEIHKYKNWQQELKNLYDGFPQLCLVFSGSSSLDITRGNYDLSRRAKIYFLPGLSLREYINFVDNQNISPISFTDLMENPHQMEKSLLLINKLKGHFQNYCRQGFYPFYFEDSLSYYERILNVIEKTIYEDIANFYNLKTDSLRHFKKILMFLASIPPGQINIHNVGNNLGIDDKTAANYLSILNETGLVRSIYANKTGNQGSRSPEKIFLDNTNLQFALSDQISSVLEIGTIRELFFIQSILNAGMELFYSAEGDYQVSQYIFEIGGKNKKFAQIKGKKNGYLVKDDILIVKNNTIPLIYFGFLY